jgi:hypothetical protein
MVIGDSSAPECSGYLEKLCSVSYGSGHVSLKDE